MASAGHFVGETFEVFDFFDGGQDRVVGGLAAGGNAAQDVALARRLDAGEANSDLFRQRWEAFLWGGDIAVQRPTGAEWYLHFRDWIYGEAQRKPPEFWLGDVR